MQLATSCATIAPGPDLRPYMAQRGISPTTLMAFGVRLGMDFFPDIGKEEKSVRFPYRSGYKARSISGKSFVSSEGFKTSFFNELNVSKSLPDIVFITEGEIDTLSLAEAGIQVNQVLSVPTGARQQQSTDPFNSKAYEYLRRSLEAGLGRVKTFVWCGDNDESGIALRSDMAAIIGEARFRYVDWPDGIKDANEMLLKEGKDALHELVRDGSLEWPVDGLYSISEIPDPPKLTLWDMGFGWGPRIRLAQRTLSVVTGLPGSGKTQFSAQVFYNIVRSHMVPACIATFETRPKPHYMRILRQLYHKKREQFLTTTELKEADDWIDGWYKFLVHHEERPTLSWLLNKAEVAVIRHGARIIMIDPWNRIEGTKDRNEMQTDYILKCLRELHLFAHDMNCHVQIIAHPAKMDSARRGNAPTLEDIAASSHWFNVVDQGFCIHREKRWEGLDRRTDAVLYHLKSRFSELGWPCEVKINYDLSTEAYVSLE